MSRLKRRGRLRRIRTAAFFFSLVFSWCAVGAPDDLIQEIEQHLQQGRYRHALRRLEQLRGDETFEISPRSLLVEAKTLAANGLVEAAQIRLEELRQMPGGAAEVDSEELFETEIRVLKSLGRSVDALKLVESRITPMDELNSPYSLRNTQLYHLYADLLLLCSRNQAAAETLFDLLENGAPGAKSAVCQTLLRAAWQRALTKRDFEDLGDLLEEAGPPLWRHFALAAFELGEKEVAKDLLERGFRKEAFRIRPLWKRFLEESATEAFLEAAAEILLELNEENPTDPSLRAMTAMTLEKIGRREEALALIEGLLDRDLELQLFAARLYAAEGRVEDASRLFAKLEAVSPGLYLEPWGSLLAELGRAEEALQIWSRIPVVDHHRPESYRKLGILLKSKGYLEEAKEAYLEGFERSNHRFHFAYELLEISLSLSDVEGALSAYQVLREQSGSQRMLWTPGRLLERLKRTQQMQIFSERLDRVLAATTTVDLPWNDLAVELATDLALHMNRVETVREWIESPPPSLTAYWKTHPLRKEEHLMSVGGELSVAGEDEVACLVFDQIDPTYFILKLAEARAAARSYEKLGRMDKARTFWRLILETPKSSPTLRTEAVLAMARLHLADYQPGEALKFLDKVSAHVSSKSVSAEATFLRAMTYTRLHEKRRSIPLLQQVRNMAGHRYADSLFWLAEWELWQRNKEKAIELYREVLAADPGQELANECLWRLRHLMELEDEALKHYALAGFFEAGGDWKDAEENYRNLVADLDQSDTADWVYYRLGELMIRSGRKEEGLEQWLILLDRSQNDTLLRKVRLEMARQGEDSTPEQFEEILMEAPNTLIGDLARDEWNKRNQNREEEPGIQVLP